MNRLQLQKALVDATGCSTQHDGWPCNSCFHNLELGITADRLHELWGSALAFRGDYSPIEVEQTPDTIKANIDELNNLLSNHKGA